MKIFYTYCRVFVCIIFVVTSSGATAQMRNNIIPHANIPLVTVSYQNQLWFNAYYESLPNDYNNPVNATKKYPLIIFLHGASQDGNGSLAQMPNVLTHSLPKFISEGTFPNAINFNGADYEPIVYIPQATTLGMGDCECQISNELFGEALMQNLNFAVARYGNRVDPMRIYLMGISKGSAWSWMGSGQSVAFASRFAAVTTFGGISSNAILDRPANIAMANLPVLSVYGASDPYNSASNFTTSHEWVAAINGTNPAPVPAAVAVSVPNGPHDIWGTASVPGVEVIPGSGRDVYQWLMSNQRVDEVLPVLLTGYKVTGTNAVANKVVVTWATGHEQNNSFFTIERSGDGEHFAVIAKIPAGGQGRGNNYSYTDNAPLAGTSYYRLSQTDLDGSVRKFGIKPVSFETGLAESLRIYPNPTVGNNLTLELNNGVTGTLHATIINPDGKVLLSNVYLKTDRFFRKSIGIGSLNKGFYLLKITGDNYLSTLRFVKE